MCLGYAGGKISHDIIKSHQLANMKDADNRRQTSRWRPELTYTDPMKSQTCLNFHGGSALTFELPLNVDKV